ncbi:MAG: hypothetical protein ACKVOO_12350 [Burkholderiaceae bacterium]
MYNATGFAALLGARNLNPLAQVAAGVGASPQLVGLATVSLASPRVSGPGYLQGTVKVITSPVARPVRLYDRASGLLLRSTTSMTDGSYCFGNLPLGRPYLVLAIDNAASPVVYNAAVSDLTVAGTT